MSNFFCECKDSGEPPCAGLVQLRADLAAAQEARQRAEAIVAAIILSYNPQELIGDLKKRGNEILERAQRAEERAEGYKAALKHIYNVALGYPYAGNSCGEIARDALGGHDAAIAEGK